jgi:hypothetical protein
MASYLSRRQPPPHHNAHSKASRLEIAVQSDRRRNSPAVAVRTMYMAVPVYFSLARCADGVCQPTCRVTSSCLL